MPGAVPNQAGELARRLGLHHVFAPSTAWGGGHEGLAVLSRFPIGAHDARPLPHSTETEGRIVLSARIDSELGRDLGAHDAPVVPRARRGASARTRCCSSTRSCTAHDNDNVQVADGRLQRRARRATRSAGSPGMTTLRRPPGRLPGRLGSRSTRASQGITWARANPYVDDAALAAARPPARLHLRDAGAARSAGHRRRRAARVRRAAPAAQRRARSTPRTTSACSPTCSCAGRAGRGEVDVPARARHRSALPGLRAASGPAISRASARSACSTWWSTACASTRWQLLEELRLDLRAQAPDHLALTGDLSNISLEGEWRAALAWIDMSGVPPEAITRDPGNHDAYVAVGGRVARVRAAVRPLHGERSAARRRRRRLSLRAPARRRRARRRLELRSRPAISAPGGGSATAQLARLEAVLGRPSCAGKTRVVLIHHPPVLHKRGRGAQPARSRRARGRARARRRRPGPARPRPRRPARRAPRAGRQAHPDHRRRLRLVRAAAPSAARAGTSTRSTAAASPG